jgi:hypothetical protein
MQVLAADDNRRACAGEATGLPKELRSAMNSRKIIPRILYLVVFALMASIVIVPAARAAGAPIPSHVNQTMANILSGARKSWHADAIITSVEMKWYPTDDLEGANTMHWLEIQANSPSTGARRYFYIGAPYDGKVVDEPVDRDSSTIDHALPPSIKLDLPDAIAFLRHAGLKDQLFFVKLVMVGAANTQPLAAWTIASLADRSLFPIALDAQTGKIIPWVRAYNPPPFTDAQMRAAWNQVLHPPSSNGNNAQKNLDCFMAVQEFGFCGN